MIDLSQFNNRGLTELINEAKAELARRDKVTRINISLRPVYAKPGQTGKSLCRPVAPVKLSSAQAAQIAELEAAIAEYELIISKLNQNEA